MSDRYTTRDWGNGRMVRFQVAPGRLEGEPIFALHFDAAAGWSDYSASDADGVFADLFRAPFNLDTLPEVDDLNEPLTEDELAVMEAAAGAVLYYRTDGFVSLELLDTAEDVDSTLRALIKSEEEVSEDDYVSPID